MRRLLVTLGTLLGLLLLAYGGVSWYMVGKAVKAQRHSIESTPAVVGLAYQEVEFQPRGEALTLRGWYIAATDSVGTLVLIHGLDSNRERGGDTYFELLRGFHDEGFNLLLFDLRAHGESDGDVVSAGVFESNDVLGGLDFVTQIKGERWERVGILGFSFGAATGLLAAEQEPRLRAVVADTSWADVSDLIAKEVADRTPISAGAAGILKPGMETLAWARYGFRLSGSRPVRAIATLPYPILLVHVEEDARIPADHSRRLKEAARDPNTELWLLPGDNHANGYRGRQAEYVTKVGGYFKRQFASEPTPLKKAA